MEKKLIMDYKEFKENYELELNEVLNALRNEGENYIESGGDDWMDMLSIIWDRDPYKVVIISDDECHKVNLLRKYIIENNFESDEILV